jgi:hypothetical protein
MFNFIRIFSVAGSLKFSIGDGAVPHTTTALITEWFHDWDSPLAPAAREIFTPFRKETKELESTPS